MLKLSRNLLDNMDRFVIDRGNQGRGRREGAPARRSTAAHDAREYEMAEVRS